MPSSIVLDGVVPVIPTPFRGDESIDHDALAACVDFAVRAGVKAVCLPAYAGEFYKLMDAERAEVVATAVRAAAGRVAVLAQSNHPSARGAAEMARKHADGGADMISFAIPRQFAIPPDDLLEYCRVICRATPLPILIQDYNPGGPTVGAEFARALADACPNFRYLKLEEGLMGAKVRAVRAATDDRVGVLEGWGGMYMLELMPSGICGIMPGLGAADLLRRVWDHARAGAFDRALDLFQHLLPQLVFALQSNEVFLWMEKRLLAARGVIPEGSAHVRRPASTPDAELLEYGLHLNRRLIAAANASA